MILAILLPSHSNENMCYAWNYGPEVTCYHPSIDCKFHDNKGCLFWFFHLSPMPTAVPETECTLNKCLSREGLNKSISAWHLRPGMDKRLVWSQGKAQTSNIAKTWENGMSTILWKLVPGLASRLQTIAADRKQRRGSAGISWNNLSPKMLVSKWHFWFILVGPMWFGINNFGSICLSVLEGSLKMHRSMIMQFNTLANSYLAALI